MKLLNGGRKKWELESRELTQDVPAVAADRASRSPAAERPEIRALRDEVIGKVGGATGFVDVRSPEEFRGEKLAPDHLPQEQSQVPGHIAGAANIPWVKAANDDGTFKCADELRDLYAAEGITADTEVIAYCRIGERCSTPGSRCRSCWASSTSRTTTAPGPSTARSSARPWSSADTRRPRARGLAGANEALRRPSTGRRSRGRRVGPSPF